MKALRKDAPQTNGNFALVLCSCEFVDVRLVQLQRSKSNCVDQQAKSASCAQILQTVRASFFHSSISTVNCEFALRLLKEFLLLNGAHQTRSLDFLHHRLKEIARAMFDSPNASRASFEQFCRRRSTRPCIIKEQQGYNSFIL